MEPIIRKVFLELIGETVSWEINANCRNGIIPIFLIPILKYLSWSSGDIAKPILRRNTRLSEINRVSALRYRGKP